MQIFPLLDRESFGYRNDSKPGRFKSDKISDKSLDRQEIKLVVITYTHINNHNFKAAIM